MIRGMLNKIFSSKAFYIVFSVLVSIALWMYVEITENVIQRHIVSDVPVTYLNKEVLDDRNLLITRVDPETVELTFECSRSDAARLTKNTLSVVIDLANITQSGYNPLRHKVAYPSNVDEDSINYISSSFGLIAVYIDTMYSQNVRVEAPYRGGAAEGFMTDSPDFSPREITVTGPAEVVSEVNVARAQIVRENLTTTLEDDFPFILLDRNGEELDEALLSQLTLSDESIHVTVPVRATKAVALTVECVYGSGVTEQNTRVTIDPPMITIAGDPEEIRDYNSLNLITIDLTRLIIFSDTNMYPIILPNNFTNISGETEARVLVELLGLDFKFLSVSNSNIHTINGPTGYTVEIRTQSLDVRIRGREEDLAGVSEANISVVADLANCGPGMQRVSARVYVDGISADVGAVGNYNITVDIQRE